MFIGKSWLVKNSTKIFLENERKQGIYWHVNELKQDYGILCIFLYFLLKFFVQLFLCEYIYFILLCFGLLHSQMLLLLFLFFFLFILLRSKFWNLFKLQFFFFLFIYLFCMFSAYINDTVIRNSDGSIVLKLVDLPIKCQCCLHIETSQLICTANQLTGFYMRATLALNRLILFLFFRGIFRNLSDIYNGAYCNNSERFLSSAYFRLRTESKILSLYMNMLARENPYSSPHLICFTWL